MSLPGSKTPTAVEAHQPLPLPEQQQQQRCNDEHVEALVAARLEERLAAQLRDVADVVFACQLDGCFSSVLESAATMGRHELLGALLKRREEGNNGDDKSTPAIHQKAPHPVVCQTVPAAFLAAAEKGHAQCLRLLLDTCSSSPSTSVTALLDARDSEGCTALMMAARQGHTECMQLLLEHSPHTQLAAVNSNGRNALFAAAYFGHAPCLRLLLTHRPDIQVAAVTTKGCNALMAAAHKGQAACVQLLLAHRPDVQVAATTTEGWNALISALVYGHAACVQLLLDHSPDVQMAAQSVNGATALSVAADEAHVSCLRLLLPHSPSKQQLDKALLKVCRRLGKLAPQQPEREQQQRSLAFKRCAELLLAYRAVLPADATDSDKEVLQPIIADLAARALVPDMANEAVVGLALAAISYRKRAAS